MGEIPEDGICTVAVEEASPCRSSSRACAVGAACVGDELTLRSALSAKCPSPFSRNRRSSTMVLPKWGRLGDCPFPDEVWRDYASKGGYYIPGALAPFSREVVWSACCTDGGYEHYGAQWVEKNSVVGFLFAHLAPHAEICTVDVARFLDIYEPEKGYISQPRFDLSWTDRGERSV